MRRRRYTAETLAVMFHGKTIADVLNLSVAAALELFANVPRIRRILKTLDDVGLGYVSLGQAAPTLSGGEAQRVKLAAELARPDTGKTLYILDEPTTGLHFDDVRKLLDVIHRLADLGNTVVVIEHNLEVIKTADWVIDLGPEAGTAGGDLVAEGTPEQIVKDRRSHTGKFLAPVLAAGPRGKLRVAFARGRNRKAGGKKQDQPKAADQSKPARSSQTAGDNGRVQGRRREPSNRAGVLKSAAPNRSVHVDGDAKAPWETDGRKLAHSRPHGQQRPAGPVGRPNPGTNRRSHRRAGSSPRPGFRRLNGRSAASCESIRSDKTQDRLSVLSRDDFIGVGRHAAVLCAAEDIYPRRSGGPAQAGAVS